MDSQQDRPRVTLMHNGEAPVALSGTLVAMPLSASADDQTCATSPTPSGDGFQEDDQCQRQYWEDAVHRNMNIADGMTTT